MSLVLLLAAAAALATPTLSRNLESNTVPLTTIVTATKTQLSENDVLRVTEAPALNKRAAETVSPNICGWYEDNGFDQGWSDADHPSITCFWNSDEHLVGTEYPLPTTCLESETAGDNLSLKCSDSHPYCATFLYGDDYSAFLCHSDKDETWAMAPTYTGMDNPIAFPIYSGSNGISTGTQYPPGYETRTTETATTDNNSDPAPSRSSSTSSSTSTAKQAAPSATEPPPPSSPPVGTIVGGVIGGLAVVGIVVCVIVFLFIRRNKRNKTIPSQDHDEPDSRSKPNEKTALWHSHPAHPPQEPEPQATATPPPPPPPPPQQSMGEETTPAYQELWAPRPGPDSTQKDARLAGGRQIYEAP